MSIFITLFLKRIFREKIINEKNKLKIKLNPIIPVSASNWIYILWGCVEHDVVILSPESAKAKVLYFFSLHRFLKLFGPIPRILLSTIHGAKGGEADKVLVLPDLTKAALDQSDKSPDELHRLFYVATKRAKKELHIVSPKNYERSYSLWVESFMRMENYF